jgi:quinol monooxygenase YgiN
MLIAATVTMGVMTGVFQLYAYAIMPGLRRTDDRQRLILHRRPVTLARLNGGSTMYARLVRFSLGPGKRAVAQALADALAPKIAAMPGCEKVAVFGDDSDGQYGIFVLWDSEANANSAAQLIRPQLDRHLAGHVQGAPDARLFEVLSK